MKSTRQFKRLITAITILISMSLCACGQFAVETTKNQKNTSKTNAMEPPETKAEIIDNETESAAWETTDHNIMMSLMQNSPEFGIWRYIFTFIPQFDADHAKHLVTSVSGIGKYYGFCDYFPEDGADPEKYSEEHMHWFLRNIFNISDEKYEQYKKYLEEIYIDEHCAGYHDGWFQTWEFDRSREPARNAEVFIDDAKYLKGRWSVTYHTENASDNRECTAVMERREIDGKWCWTIHSLLNTKEERELHYLPDSAANNEVINAEVSVSTPVIVGQEEAIEFLNQDEAFLRLVTDERYGEIAAGTTYAQDSGRPIINRVISVDIQHFSIMDLLPELYYSYAVREAEACWFVKNFFHVSDEDYMKYRDDMEDEWDEFNSWGYHDGVYEIVRSASSVPVNSYSICGIESVTVDGTKWDVRIYIKMHDLSQRGTTDDAGWGTAKDEISSEDLGYIDAVMERVTIMDKDYWTFYSLRYSFEE